MGKKDTTPVINQPITGAELEGNEKAVAQSPAVPQNSALNTKNSKNNKKGVDPNKKGNAFTRFFKRIGNAFKNMWKELKVVSWPKPAKVLASTGVVLLVVGIFFGILMGFNSLFTWILDLIINL